MDELNLLQEALFVKFFTALLLIKVCHCNDPDVSALLALKQSVVDPSGTLESWSGSNPCRNWTGIGCGLSNRVTNISLQGLSLSGSLPLAGFGNLTSLMYMNLSRNYLRGNIPSDLCSCSGLRFLDLSQNELEGDISAILFAFGDVVELNLSHNNFTGHIPSTIGNLQNLQRLNLSTNSLRGGIPMEVGNCTKLQSVDLSRANLSGGIPSSFFQLAGLTELYLFHNNLNGTLNFSCNSSSLLTLDLHRNKLSGPIPEFLSQLRRMVVLRLSANRFHGEIPASFSNLTKLQIFAISKNKLWGAIPAQLGRLSALQNLDLHQNHISGPIPKEICSCQELLRLVLSDNQLSSEIPVEIGNLTALQSLALAGNNLSGIIPVELGMCRELKSLDLSWNCLSGQVPQELSSIANLSMIYLSCNALDGWIPSGFGTMKSLEYLDLSHNRLNGSIPDEFVSESSLLGLVLAGNNLSGFIPSTIHNLLLLSELDLSGNELSGVFNVTGARLLNLLLNDNRLSGSLPSSLGSLTELLSLDFHGNMFSGEIPEQIVKLHQIQFIDLSNNQFSGRIPVQLSSLSFLTSLNLSNNYLDGSIPSDIVHCTSLTTANLSRNNLTGAIPSFNYLGPTLILDVSDNDLSGKIPARFNQSNASLFAGNPELCGRPLEIDCPVSEEEHHEHTTSRLVILVATGIAATIIFAALFMIKLTLLTGRRPGCLQRDVAPYSLGKKTVTLYLQNWLSSMITNGVPMAASQLTLTFDDLRVATGNFSSDNMIGDGGFGNVYRGVLKDGSAVAVKKLTEDGFQGEREFEAEMETLGGVNHKNLVPLLGHCIAGLERLLVYKYMPNNSLDAWLHNRTEGMEPLSWPVRLSIAKDVARGLTFLHHFHIPHIIHRDLKTSNILLDEHFNARVSDFGLARLMNTYDSHVSTEVAGSLGYIAPEYANSWRITIRGDVFSFGVVLLELISGMRPAGIAFKPTHGGNLVGWVRHLQQIGQTEALFDAEISAEGFETKIMVALEVAFKCTQENPCKRPRMLDALRLLEDQI